MFYKVYSNKNTKLKFNIKGLKMNNLIYKMISKYETKHFNSISDLDKYILKNKIYNFEIEIIKGKIK